MMKGVIFDLDGVLVHTDELHYKAWDSLAFRLGIPFDRTINDRLRGVSRMQSLEIILEKSPQSFSTAEKEILANEKNETYRNFLVMLTPSDVSDEVRETLVKLKNKNIKLAIGSSSKNARLILDNTDLTKYFDAISDGNNITKSKPDPEVFIKAAEYLCIDAKDCLVIEDAEAGILAAKNGGFKAAGYGRAQFDANADYSLKKIKDILSLV